MAILVHTQYLENYGLDNVGGSFNVWKFKGGSGYKILGTDHRPANAFALVAETLHNGPMGLIQRGATIEVPTWWEHVADNDEPANDYETWHVLEYERKRSS